MRPSNTLRITLRFALLTGLGLLGAALCLLSETDGKHPETTESSRSGTSADSASSPEMQRLERVFAGTWSTSESFARNEFYPNGAERKGTAQFRLATGGTSLIEEVHSDGSAGRLDFMVVIWWDSEAKVYNFLPAGTAAAIPVRFAAQPTGTEIHLSTTTNYPLGAPRTSGRIPSQISLQRHSHLSRQWNQATVTLCNK
jgi:hypothetical protein